MQHRLFAQRSPGINIGAKMKRLMPNFNQPIKGSVVECRKTETIVAIDIDAKR